MRTVRTNIISIVLLLASLCTPRLLASEATAQDRPLFRPGAAPAKVDGATERESGSLVAGSSRSFANELLPTGLALGATLLAIVLARSAIKRFGGKLPGARRPQGVVEVLARYPIARGQQVVLLKVGRRVIVTHQGAQGMQALSEFSAEADVADLLARCEAGSRAASGFSFDALLRQSNKAHEKPETPPAAVRTDRRTALPEFMRNAEIETVDLTRGKRGGAR